jgi:hypothetical protein
VKKILIRTVISLIVTVLGLYLIYFALVAIKQEHSPLLYGTVGLILLAFGGYLLITSSKHWFPDNKPETKEPENKRGLEGVLEKNNKLSSRYSEIIEKRDKLKMLEISAAAEELKEKEL